MELYGKDMTRLVNFYSVLSDTFIEDLNKILVDYKQKSYKGIILVGDINLHHLIWDGYDGATNANEHKLFNLMVLYNLSNIITSNID